MLSELGGHRDVTGTLTAEVRRVYEIVEDEKAME